MIFCINLCLGGSSFSTGATSGPFGQTFGKNTTAGFTTSAFGSSGPSLFGSTAPATQGLFGGATSTPVFGQTTTTQASAFGNYIILIACIWCLPGWWAVF